MTNAKVKLYNNGGYEELDSLDFDTVFDAVFYKTSKGEVLGADISALDLIDAGADNMDTCEAVDSDGMLYFSNGVASNQTSEYEVID